MYSSEKGISYRLGPPKTKESKRVIDLDDKTISLLYELKNYKKENEDGFIEDDFIFGNVTPYKKSTIREINKRYSELAEVPYIKLHAFRHSHATFLISQTGDYKAVAKRLGHKNEKETIETYSHLIDENRERLLNVINSINV